MADKPKTTKRKREPYRKQQEAFVLAFVTPTSPSYRNGAKSAVEAGYSPATANQQASRLLKRPHIKKMVDAAMSAMARKLTEEGGVTVAFIEQKHLEGMDICLAAGDRTNHREHLVALGKMRGAYDQSMRLDVTVRQEYDERLAVEASRIARLRLEEAGSKGLGALPAATVTQEPIEAEIVEPEPSSQASEPVRVVDGLTSGEREPELVEA